MKVGDLVDGLDWTSCSLNGNYEDFAKVKVFISAFTANN